MPKPMPPPELCDLGGGVCCCCCWEKRENGVRRSRKKMPGFMIFFFQTYKKRRRRAIERKLGAVAGVLAVDLVDGFGAVLHVQFFIDVMDMLPHRAGADG